MFKCRFCHCKYEDDFCSDDDVGVCRWCSGEEEKDIEIFGRSLNKDEADAMDELAILRSREADQNNLSDTDNKRYVELFEFLSVQRGLPIPFGVEI